MPKQELAHYRAILLQLRARLAGDVAMLAQEALSPEGGTTAGAHPTHPADVGSDNYEQEFTLSLMSNEGDRLAQVEAALARISSGQYGSCIECGGRIAKTRLEVLPDTPYCVKCSSQLQG